MAGAAWLRRTRALMACAVALHCASASGQTAAPSDDTAFVRARGTRLYLADRPFAFVGANVAVVHGPQDRAALDEVLDAVVADGLSVVRVWAFGEAPSDAPPWQRDFAFRAGPQGWIEPSFVHVDRVLSAARARHLRVILVLGNRWGDYGGVPEYLRWAGAPCAARDPTPAEMGRFYACPSCRNLYLQHVARLVDRVNTLDGARYSDDPTLFSWELLNEGTAATSAGEDAMVRWTRAVASFVRAHDRHHLVGAGHIGYARVHERRVWQRVCALRDIDYCDSHAYPDHGTSVDSFDALGRWIDDRVQLAHHVAHKPMIWGEIGFRTDLRTFRGTTRDRWYDAFLERSFRDGVAGTLAWIYQRWSGSARNYALYVDPAEAHRTRDVREVLSRWAAAARTAAPAEDNPTLSDARGDEPLFIESTTVRGRHGRIRWRRTAGTPEPTHTLSLDPLAFSVARFESAGVYAEGPVEQLWGAGAGFADYRFTAPRARASYPSELRIEARISSELPGAGEGATEADTSDVTILVDGIEVGRWTAPADDAIGRPMTLVVSDAALLQRIFATHRRSHVLRFAAADTPGAGGLCVYRGATGRVPLDPAIRATLPGQIRLTWVETGTGT